MNESNLSVGVIEPPRDDSATSVKPTTVTPGLTGRLSKLGGQIISLALALSCLGGLVALGHWTGWSMPKFSTLLGQPAPPKDDWCEAHSVPDSICAECRFGIGLLPSKILFDKFLVGLRFDPHQTRKVVGKTKPRTMGNRVHSCDIK